MIQVVLNISNKKKWNALKNVLEAMNIDYIVRDTLEKLSEKEFELLRNAESDEETGRLYPYTNHRDILNRH